MIAAETLFPVSAVSKLRTLVYDILPPTLKTLESDGGSVRGTPQGDGGSVRGTVTAVFHRETPAQKCMLTEPAVVNGVGRGSSSADSASSPTRSSRRFQSQVRQGSFAPESAFSADSLTVFAQPLSVVT